MVSPFDRRLGRSLAPDVSPGGRVRDTPSAYLSIRGVDAAFPNLHGTSLWGRAFTRRRETHFAAASNDIYRFLATRTQSTPCSGGENRPTPCSTKSTTAASWN